MGHALPAAWAGQPQWRVLDTAFGHGGRFLATWQAWRSDPARPGLLHFLAIEPRPVAADDLLGAASREVAPLAGALARCWHGLTPGLHRFVLEGGQVLLTLAVGEVDGLLPQLDFTADAVVLEDIASLDTLKAVARLCRRDTAVSARAASDQQQRDLASCGFVQGRYAPRWEVRSLRRSAPPTPGQCVVVGAGIAGAAVAASLARRGWQVEVLDAAATPAAGASALPVGLMAPHQSPDDNPLSRLSRAGIRITLQECARLLKAGDWQATGVLESRGDDARAVPTVAGLDAWSREASASEKSVLPPATCAWWHEFSAWVRPGALVRAWLAAPQVRFRGGCDVAAIERSGDAWLVRDARGAVLAEAPLVVVAAAHGTSAVTSLVTHPVRGQVSSGPWREGLPAHPVNGNGHFVPVAGAGWFSGSTYGRGDNDAAAREADQDANLQRLRALLPGVAELVQDDFAAGRVQAWAGVRCASADRRPLVGEMAPGLWVSTAMGSRGLTFAALCAELIAARLHDEPLPVEAKLARALAVGRVLGSLRESNLR